LSADVFTTKLNLEKHSTVHWDWDQRVMERYLWLGYRATHSSSFATPKPGSWKLLTTSMHDRHISNMLIVQIIWVEPCDILKKIDNEKGS